jgi:hypothetical protein
MADTVTLMGKILKDAEEEGLYDQKKTDEAPKTKSSGKKTK